MVGSRQQRLSTTRSVLVHQGFFSVKQCEGKGNDLVIWPDLVIWFGDLTSFRWFLMLWVRSSNQHQIKQLQELPSSSYAKKEQWSNLRSKQGKMFIYKFFKNLICLFWSSRMNKDPSWLRSSLLEKLFSREHKAVTDETGWHRRNSTWMGSKTLINDFCNEMLLGK